ncbi:MAG: sulfatase [Bacteroidetes bacterium HGW-Bacteroidetes-12]|nr:MAG: sulfatase [Bacteroidetes bacterium HGW-Bacteroidetes-12]
MKIIPKRMYLLLFFASIFLILSTLTRIIFYIWSFNNLDFSIVSLVRIFLTGIFYDLGTISYFLVPYVLYLFLLPAKFIGSLFDKIVTYIAYFIGTFTLTFTTFAEFTFWDEFFSRFNFISVDYLIYTFEVVENINQTYPVPFLVSIIFIIVLGIFLLGYKKGFFQATFQDNSSLKKLFPLGLTVLCVCAFFTIFIKNEQAEWSLNRYENELSKTGIYSFFAAFKNNELSYTDFYLTQNIDESINLVKKLIVAENDSLAEPNSTSVNRFIKNIGTAYRPNVIFICIESFSAEFMEHFGNNKHLTPFLDSLAEESILLTNLYATGTRTIRGMEAITLSIPPSPGRSIVKRKNNTNMFTIGSVFKEKGYKDVFFYGGDGYFDNMNQFFGGNGFDIVDRGRGFLLGDDFTAKRTNINDNEVQFENAWGICDEDIYTKVLKEADLNYKSNTPFFNFIMTTSNHKPYTYPDNRVDIPSGSNRDGAVKYTDYAIHEFIEHAKTKPWFENTVFVIMADHCASSAGKGELDVNKYHIPAIIYNLKEKNPTEINQLCSQIDVFPSLFGMLHWSYTSQFMGIDINKPNKTEERAFIGNYTKLALLKDHKLMVLNEKKGANFYQWNKENNQLNRIKIDSAFLKETMAYYQTNDYFYKKGLLK